MSKYPGLDKLAISADFVRRAAANASPARRAQFANKQQGRVLRLQGEAGGHDARGISAVAKGKFDASMPHFEAARAAEGHAANAAGAAQLAQQTHGPARPTFENDPTHPNVINQIRAQNQAQAQARAQAQAQAQGKGKGKAAPAQAAGQAPAAPAAGAPANPAAANPPAADWNWREKALAAAGAGAAGLAGAGMFAQHLMPHVQNARAHFDQLKQMFGHTPWYATPGGMAGIGAGAIGVGALGAAALSGQGGQRQPQGYPGYQGYPGGYQQPMQYAQKMGAERVLRRYGL